MKIQVKKARILLNACTVLTSGTHTILTALASGDKAAAAVPYELEDQTRWNVDKNLGLAKRIVDAADKLRETAGRATAKAIYGGSGIGRTISAQNNPVEWAAYQERLEKIENIIESAPFLRIRETGLKISNANPVPGIIKAALCEAGVLVEDVKAAPEADTIADAPDQVPDDAAPLTPAAPAAAT